jgi:hypothetical protein
VGPAAGDPLRRPAPTTLPSIWLSEEPWLNLSVTPAVFQPVWNASVFMTAMSANTIIASINYLSSLQLGAFEHYDTEPSTPALHDFPDMTILRWRASSTLKLSNESDSDSMLERRVTDSVVLDDCTDDLTRKYKSTNIMLLPIFSCALFLTSQGTLQTQIRKSSHTCHYALLGLVGFVQMPWRLPSLSIKRANHPMLPPAIAVLGLQPPIVSAQTLSLQRK